MLGFRGEREHVQFERIAGEYALVIQNDLTDAVAADVSVTDANGEGEAKTVSVEANEAVSIPGLFETDAGPYSVSVSANGETIARELEPTSSPNDEFTYTVSASGFEFQEGYRPASDLIVSNGGPERIDVRVEIDSCSGDRHVYDSVAVPADETSSFRGVFGGAAEYGVTVQARDMEESITHRNSRTNSVFVDVEPGVLSLQQWER